MDPNMDPEAARGMTINIKFKPSKAGTIAATYDIKTKLAGLQKSETTFLIGQDARTGRIEISEYGNNRPQVAAYDTAPVSSRQPEPDPLRLHGQGKGNYRRHSVVSRGLYKRLQQ